MIILWWTLILTCCIRVGEPEEGGVGQVVIQKLTPLHHVVGI